MKKRVEIISTSIIKPSSPTPNDKRHIKLSFIDQTFSKIFPPVIFFYNAPQDNSRTIYSLKKSLSKALELFYPFAGQHDEALASYECNDYGAYFLEAEIHSKLSDFLRNPNHNTVTKLLPTSDPNTLDKVMKNHVITLAQLTLFSCGGIAISVQVSHKIADAFSMSRFVKTWASINADRDVTPPMFATSAILPPIAPIKYTTPKPKKAPLIRSQRLIFTATKLADLKNKIKHNGVDFVPSTLETISSLLFRCVVASSGARALLQMVNLRERLPRSSRENFIGNFSWPLIISSGENKNPMKLHEIATIMRKGFSKFFSNCKEDSLKTEVLASMVERFTEEKHELALEGIGLNWVSFLSSFRLYETDFGWGEPLWVSAPLCLNRSFVMMHSKSGQDVEVWATLEEDVMEKFKRNEELLAFASLDVPKKNPIGHCRL